MLVLLPFIIGFLIEKLLIGGTTADNQLHLNLGSILLSIWIYGSGVVYWFYVGRVFGRLNMYAVKSFILGNIVWGISISLYFWQYNLLDDVSRNPFIAGISEAYPLAFINLGVFISSTFITNYGNTMVITSYFLMFIVFIFGFKSTLRKNH
jgi:hypothetical protein